MLLLLSADFFFQNLLFQKIHSGIILSVSNGLDPDQDQHYVALSGIILGWAGSILCENY